MFKKVFSLLTILFAVLSINAQMVLEFDTRLIYSSEITLPLGGDVDVTIDWGDGVIEEIDTAGYVVHSYSKDTIYMVVISGILTAFGYGNTITYYNPLVACRSFGNIGLVNLSGAFSGAGDLNELPDQIPSTVNNISYMFTSNDNTELGISDWDVSNVVNMRYLFRFCRNFNEDIGNWDVSNVTDMSYMFFQAESFNQDINDWDVSNVTDMSYMFEAATTFNQNIGNWDVSNVTRMRYMFGSAYTFNQNIGNWDVSNVTDMHGMFHSADDFNQNIGNLDVSNVTDMSYMFSDAKSFNKDIGDWNIGKVRYMVEMFFGASSFNQDISDWNVSNVNSMYGMFENAILFNCNIGGWDVSEVTSMTNMFKGASSFNQDLRKWGVRQVTYMTDMFESVTLSTAFYNNLLISWSKQNPQNNVTFNAGNSMYSSDSAINARNILTDTYGWVITDGGVSELPVLITKSISNITKTSVISGGVILDEGVSNVSIRGVVWDTITTPHVVTNLGQVNNGSGLGDYTCTIDNLNWGKTYYLRAYAISDNDTVYGQTIEFIPQKAISLAGSFLINNKEYDGTINATLESSNLDLTDVEIGYNNVTLSRIYPYYDNKDAGKNKTVTLLKAKLVGDDANRYFVSVEELPTSFADIKTKELTVERTFTYNKTYDGTTNIHIYGSKLVGIIFGDTVFVDNQEGVFSDKNVGIDKPITALITIIGKDTSNYRVIQPDYLTADIYPKSLAVNNLYALTKEYDGNNAAIISGDESVGIIESDDIDFIKLEGQFDDENAGLSKSVTCFLSLSGTDTINYTLIQPTGLTADITKKELIVTGATVSNKIYDGTSATAISGIALEGVILGDDLVIADSSASFDNKNVGTTKTVTSNIVLTGADTINYSLTQPTGLTADITKKELIVTGATASNKTYDGTSATAISGIALEGVILGDDLVIADSTATFDNKNVGTSKPITSKITLSGTDTINYSLIQPKDLTADIAKKELPVTNAFAVNKVYDGITTTKVSGATIYGVVSGDDLIIADSSAIFDTKNVGTSKSVTSNIVLSGIDNINYALVQPAGLTADITKKELTIEDAIVNNKIYDGSTSIEISNASLSGFISGDDVAIKDTVGSVVDKNIGESKEVSSAITLSGVDTINYYLTQPTGLTVDITPKTITLSGSFTANDKDYDETTDATIKDSNLVLDGVNSPDIVTISTLVLNFSQAEIGNDITVTITEAEISGVDAQNYELSLDGAPTTTANINEHVGVNETNNLQLSVYPNPFVDHLTIDAQTKISSISLTTITGTTVAHKDGSSLNNINVSQLPQGVYLVNVVLENNQSKTFKMIKK